MSTIVAFHAHPDDEAISTGGVMAKYASEGHRVVLVVATRGEHGEVADGVLAPGEQLWERRVREVSESARILGVARVEYLGYVDSGMMGTPENDAPDCFWRASVDEAAARLAGVLREESAEVLLHYDENGGYGHPDHIQVNRVGTRAAELAGTARIYQATMNRDHIMRLMSAFVPTDDMGDIELPDPAEIDSLGMTEDEITTMVDVRDFIVEKRASMAAHASQIHDTSFFLQMPEEQFLEAFGYEWFIRHGEPGGIHEYDLFEGAGS